MKSDFCSEALMTASDKLIAPSPKMFGNTHILLYHWNFVIPRKLIPDKNIECPNLQTLVPAKYVKIAYLRKVLRSGQTAKVSSFKIVKHS